MIIFICLQFLWPSSNARKKSPVVWNLTACTLWNNPRTMTSKRTGTNLSFRPNLSLSTTGTNLSRRRSAKSTASRTISMPSATYSEWRRPHWPKKKLPPDSSTVCSVSTGITWYSFSNFTVLIGLLTSIASIVLIAGKPNRFGRQASPLQTTRFCIRCCTLSSRSWAITIISSSPLTCWMWP